MRVQASTRLVVAVATGISLLATAIPRASSQLVSKATRSQGRNALQVRERRVVTVNGAPEIWELQWASRPVLVCQPDDPGWFTCPCGGFEFGETGDLALVRSRDSHEVERLDLTPFFAGHETPAWETKKAVVARWPVVRGDVEAFGEADLDEGRLATFKRQVTSRPSVSILRVADFNRDGSATEFVLQVGVLPCGKKESILIGTSPDRPQLHAFGTAEHPDIPLILYVDLWARIRSSQRPFRVVTWACGDHDSDVQWESTLSVDRAGIHATEQRFACEGGTKRGRRLSRKVL